VKHLPNQTVQTVQSKANPSKQHNQTKACEATQRNAKQAAEHCALCNRSLI
jgi:hypothetical protein